MNASMVPVFHRMQFSEAIEGGWLTDYKVIILTLKPDQVSVPLENYLAREKETGLNLEYAVKLLGCWDALADPEGFLSDRNVTGDQHNPLLRAITFTNTIKVSRMVEAHWQDVLEAVRATNGRGTPGNPSCPWKWPMWTARRTRWTGNASWLGSRRRNPTATRAAGC